MLANFLYCHSCFFNSHFKFVIFLTACQLYNSYNVSSKNLVLDQLIILKFIFFFILITYLHIFKFVLIVAVYYVLILCTISPQKLKQASQ